MQDSHDLTVVNVPVTINSGNGTLRSTIPVPARETNITALLPIVREFTSQLTQQVSVSMERQGQPVSCGPKCTACCYQLVPLTPFEAESLASWIQTLPQDQQHVLAARFHAALLKLQEREVLAQLTPQMFSMPADVFQRLGADYFRAGVACPFLADGLCSIHPVRPLVCREYMVVTPPEYCAEPGHPRAEVIVLPMQPSRALIKLGSRVEGEPGGWLPLIFLFHWMTARSNAGKWVSGTGPAVLGEFLNTLAQQPGVNVSYGVATSA